jgi:hypothetical protein
MRRNCTVRRIDNMSKIFKQHNIGKFWGIVAQVIGQLGFFVWMMILFMNSVEFYNDTVSSWLVKWGIETSSATFWGFMAVVIGLLVVISFLLWQFALPSFFAFWNEQFYKHDNPVKKDLAKMATKTDLINLKKEILEAIKK